MIRHPADGEGDSDGAEKAGDAAAAGQYVDTATTAY